MRTILLAAGTCAILYAPRVHAELEPKSRNTVLFVASAQKGHEWEAYRLAEDRRPVIFDVRGPGRVLLTLRTFAEAEAVSVVLLDDRIILTAKVEPKVDESAKFPDAETRVPSKVRFYLVRVPAGPHQITVRYSGGPPTLVTARFSETDGVEEGEPELATPKEREDVVPQIGTLRAAGELEVEPQEKRKKRRAEIDAAWKERPVEREEALEPRAGPPQKTLPARTRASLEEEVEKRTLMVEAPWLLIEAHAGAQVNRLGLSVAPAFGVDGRVPVPRLDAKSFTAGLSAEIAYTQGESPVKIGDAIVDVAEVRHTAFTLSADLRWVFLREQIVDPYLSIGGGALFGSMSSSIEEQRISAPTKGAFGLLVAGAAMGTARAELGAVAGARAVRRMGHRPFVEARLQAGFLSSSMIRNGESAHLAASLAIGFRFEFLTEVAAVP